MRYSEIKNNNRELFPVETKKNLQLVNEFWEHLYSLLNNKIQNGLIEELQFGIQAPEYFIINYSIPKEISRQNIRILDTIIIRVTENEKGELNLIAIGKAIIETNSKVFAEKIYDYVHDITTKMLDINKLKK
jgi:hypothetical protein